MQKYLFGWAFQVMALMLEFAELMDVSSLSSLHVPITVLPRLIHCMPFLFPNAFICHELHLWRFFVILFSLPTDMPGPTSSPIFHLWEHFQSLR